MKDPFPTSLSIKKRKKINDITHHRTYVHVFVILTCFINNSNDGRCNLHAPIRHSYSFPILTYLPAIRQCKQCHTIWGKKEKHWRGPQLDIWKWWQKIAQPFQFPVPHLVRIQRFAGVKCHWTKFIAFKSCFSVKHEKWSRWTENYSRFSELCVLHSFKCRCKVISFRKSFSHSPPPSFLRRHFNLPFGVIVYWSEIRPRAFTSKPSQLNANITMKSIA